MKTLSISLISLVAAVLGATSQAELEHRFPFREAGVQTGRSLEKFSATLTVKSDQAIASGGIRLEIELLNGAEQPITLKNPLDFLEYSLVDHAGAAMQLPGRSLKFRINTRRPVPNHAFRVLRLSVNSQEVTDRDCDSETIRVPVGARFQMELLIEKVRKSSSNQIPVPIPAGAYTLYVVLGLMSGDGQASLQLDSQRVDISLR